MNSKKQTSLTLSTRDQRVRLGLIKVIGCLENFDTEDKLTFDAQGAKRGQHPPKVGGYTTTASSNNTVKKFIEDVFPAMNIIVKKFKISPGNRRE